MSKETDILLEDLLQAKKECGKGTIHIADLNSRIDKLSDQLSVSKKLSDNIGKINNDLKRMKKILKSLSIIPIVDVFAGPVEVSIEDAEDMISPIYLNATELTFRIKPIKDKLRNVDSKVKQAIEYYDDLRKHTDDLRHTVEITDDCAKRQGRNPISLAVGAFSKRIDPGVKDTVGILIQSDRTMKELDDALLKISDELKDIASFDKIINAFQKEINSLSDLLVPIQNVLNKEVIFSYNVKVKTHIDRENWWNPLSWGRGWTLTTINFALPVKKILNGINTGIPKVDKELLVLAKDAIGSINLSMSKLCPIHGVNDLHEKISEATVSTDGIRIKLVQIEEDLEKVMQKTTEMQEHFESFDIICA
jgi:hypothetical protein